MQNEETAGLPGELHTIVKRSLHARKWATISQRGTLSNTSGAVSLDEADSAVSGESWSVSPLPEEREEGTEKKEALAETSDVSDYELSSRSKRKLSRAPGFLEGGSKVITDMLVGVTGIDLLSDVEDYTFSSGVNMEEEKPDEVIHDFKRRNTRQIIGPSGETIVVQSKKGGVFTDGTDESKCILDVEPGDQELIGFVDRVVDSSYIQNGGSCRSPMVNGEAVAPANGDKQTHRNEMFFMTNEQESSSSKSPGVEHGTFFGKPVLSSTFLNENGEVEMNNYEDEQMSLDSSEYSPSVSGSPPVGQHLSFHSADLPLNGKRVAPIPRVVDLQRGRSKRGDDGTTSESDDFFSSQPSSQGDPMNSILPPIYSQAVKTTITKEEPDFEELERYFPTHQMSLFIGTWNMHSEKEVPLLVEDFLLPPESEFLQDMYVIGTQECTPHKREWEVTVQATLGPTHVLVRSESLGDIHLIILVRREMIWVMRDVQSSTVACGAGGVMRNKGAVGIVLTIFGSSVLFITSHLRAHSSKVKERNLDAVRIASSLDFSRYHGNLETGKENPDPPQDCTDKADCVFWFGDLNYRVTCEREEADIVIQNNDLELLIKNDQLLEQIRQRQAFTGFDEAPINFPPTFKFDPGTSDYDTSTKQRVPSYTDRILYKSRHDAVTPQLYHFCPNLTFSDHRPVFGVYLVTLKPSPMSATIRATGWFDKRAYARGMKRRQLHPKTRKSSSERVSSIEKPRKHSSFVMKAVNKPVQKVMTATHKSSIVCSIM